MQTSLGLTSQQAAAKLAEFGPNEIRDLFRVSPATILIRQVKKNFVAYLLFAAAIISFLVGKTVTGSIILAIISIIIAIGFFQEYKAERAIQSLKQMIMPLTITRRNGRETEIPSRELVPDDVIILRTGEKVPADCRILECNELRLDESILTGESMDVEKNASPERGASEESERDRDHLLFMGTHITSGTALARVTHTGMNTEFGKIARMISGAEKEMPLQDKVNHIAKIMVTVALSVSALTGLSLLLRAEPLTPAVGIEILVTILALSVSAFPEGLPVVLMSTLAGGAYAMAKKNAIVNRMSIIETLGETTVVCSDKTGTITTGEMTVKHIVCGGREYEVTGAGYRATGTFLRDAVQVDPAQEPDLTLLLKAGATCNDALIERTGEDGDEYKLIGTPTEGALLVSAAKAGLFKSDLYIQRLSEMPFSSERKMMSVHVSEDSGETVYAKGAPEVLLGRCTAVRRNGKNVRLTQEYKTAIEKAQSALAQKKERVIALAFKPYRSGDPEKGLVFLGLAGIDDPPREEVRHALASCRRAGIRVKMITGDNKETAVEIAREIGLDGGTITGTELDGMTDDELKVALKETAVFARVRPEHKIRIVRALKENGDIVTMTGDGVNDAPALKEAHIGVAMGKNGTDVSREAADLILKDDNFSTIVAAIQSGRTIFANIQKFVVYQLSLNYGELFVIFFGALFGLPLPLLALQILFMNMVTDNLSALSLGFNPAPKDIMDRKPRVSSSILDRSLLKLLAFTGTIIGGVSLAVFTITLEATGDVTLARTHTLIALIFLEIANAFNFRSFDKSIFQINPLENRYLVGASALSIGITIGLINIPAMRNLFELAALPITNILAIAAISLSIIVIFEIKKLFARARSARILDATAQGQA